MYIQEIENQIIERLQNTNPDLQVESFPANFAEWPFTHSVGAILVRYQGSSFSESQSIGLVLQDEKIDFTVCIGLRYLNNFQEAYTHLLSVKKALTGYKIEGCTKLQATKAEFITEENTDLWYGITFSLTRTAIESVEETTPVLLKKITIENNFGDTKVCS